MWLLAVKNLAESGGIVESQKKYVCVDCANKPMSKKHILIHIILEHINNGETKTKIFQDYASAVKNFEDDATLEFWSDMVEFESLLHKGNSSEFRNDCLLTKENMRRKLVRLRIPFDNQDTKKELMSLLRRSKSQNKPNGEEATASNKDSGDSSSSDYGKVTLLFLELFNFSN